MALVGVDRLHAGTEKIGWLAVAACIFNPYLNWGENGQQHAIFVVVVVTIPQIS